MIKYTNSYNDNTFLINKIIKKISMNLMYKYVDINSAIYLDRLFSV